MSDAFAEIRTLFGEPRPPRLTSKKFDDELVQMQPSEGLYVVREHQVAQYSRSAVVPDVTEAMKLETHLWVVRIQDCVHAQEYGAFGKKLGNGCIKHTNLTGGDSAFAGGELLWVGDQEVIVNGCSGRYGPQSAEEMAVAAKSFAKAGYRTWSTGYDHGSGHCFKFGASVPMEVFAT